MAVRVHPVLGEFIIGFDPGIHGAMAMVEFHRDMAHRVIAVRDLPLVEVNGKSELLLAQIVATIGEWRALAGDPVCCIERVHAAPGQGVASMFRFGYAAGSLAGIVTALGLPLSFITPQRWQRLTQTASNPDAARQRAS